MEAFRQECELGQQARDAVKFLLVPPVPLLVRGPYRVLAAAAVGLLPPWSRRMLHLPLPPGLDPVAIRPAATVLMRTLGWLMTDFAEHDRDDRLLSA
jgi:uncharacterized protein (DUF2236 family)